MPSTIAFTVLQARFSPSVMGCTVLQVRSSPCAMGCMRSRVGCMRKTLVARRGRAGRMLGVIAQQAGKLRGISAGPRQRRAETGDRGQLAGTGAPERHADQPLTNFRMTD